MRPISLNAVREVLRDSNDHAHCPTAHAVDMRDHSAVPCFLCKQTFVVNDAPDMSLSARCQWLDEHLRHNELDADELAPQAVKWAESILASAGA
jgi:hypothetical protein